MSVLSFPCLPRLVDPNPNRIPFPYPTRNPTHCRIHRFVGPLKPFSPQLSNDHRSIKASSSGDLLRQLSLSVVLFGLGLSGLSVFSAPALARISPASIAQQQETKYADNVEQIANVESFEDEKVKAAFDLWKSKTYALTVPLKIVALEGSLPPIWIREFLRSQGKRVKFQPVFRRSLKDIFHQLSDPPIRRKINPKSAAVADVVALGDSWLNFAIEKGLIEPMKGLEEQDWFNDLSDKWKVYLRRSSKGNLDSQGTIWAVPYRWGTMVIAYNKKEFLKHKLAPIEDWSDLWRPDLAGKISMVDSSREIVGAVLKHMGASYNTSDIDSEVVGGRHAVQRQLDLLFQQVRLFDSQHYLKAFKAGDVWVAVGWSSDVLPTAKTMSNIAVIVPKSGASLWADLWAVPNVTSFVTDQIGGRVRGPSPLVYQWIEFCLQPDRTLPFKVEIVVGASPISLDEPLERPQERHKGKPKLDTNLIANMPPADILSKCEFLEPLSEDALSDYQWLLSSIQEPNHGPVQRMQHFLCSVIPDSWFKMKAKVA
ncbi:hypothetical protein F511_18787 [Dorcoceras hygrometricum]|uniref:Putrescine-binding periplasmic protein-related n=1 Tax=Dorcoceras hygrometricum TaxID=472368 RepID=A0A2Z7ADV8_9LAMI|nr:hypothetical protein F511_18787 [Dorcoceras hygrometricum]